MELKIVPKNKFKTLNFDNISSPFYCLEINNFVLTIINIREIK